MNQPLIIAHRGSSAAAPENTLAAFARAVADGAEGIELDVRLSGDGAAVVFHDADLGRIAGRERRVAEMTLDELAGIDVGAWFDRHADRREGPSFAGEPIPTLAATLGFLEDYAGIVYIELKCGGREVRPLAEAVAEAVGASPLRARTIVKSFNSDAVPLVRERCPEVRTATLFSPQTALLLGGAEGLVGASAEMAVDLISVDRSLATETLVRKAAERDLPVAVWTVDEPDELDRAARLGIAHVITNEPALLLDRRTALSRPDRRAG